MHPVLKQEQFGMAVAFYTALSQVLVRKELHNSTYKKQNNEVAKIWSTDGNSFLCICPAHWNTNKHASKYDFWVTKDALHSHEDISSAKKQQNY